MGDDEPLSHAEGFTLSLAPGTRTGYTNVRFQARNTNRPYAAQTRENGSIKHLGSFATAVEAAVCIARHAAEHGGGEEVEEDPGNAQAAPTQEEPPLGVDSDEAVMEERLEAQIEQVREPQEVAPRVTRRGACLAVASPFSHAGPQQQG
jgi:hypothetical protein